MWKCENGKRLLDESDINKNTRTGDKSPEGFYVNSAGRIPGTIVYHLHNSEGV
jgi:hypothetical protein